MVRLLSLQLILGLLATIISCGCAEEADLGPTGTVTGNVTYNGKPLAEGTQVVFMHRKGGYAGLGGTDAAGNFSIIFHRKSGTTPEMPIGEYVVMIQPPTGSDSTELEPADAELADPSAGMSPDEMVASNRKQRFQKTEFPMKYRQPSTSGLIREVKEGENTFEIDLK